MAAVVTKRNAKKPNKFFFFLNIIEFEKALHHNQNDGPDVAIGQQKAGAIEIDRFYTTRLASMYTFYLLFCFPCFVHGMMMAHRAREPIRHLLLFLYTRHMKSLRLYSFGGMFLTAAAGPQDKYTTPLAVASARFFFSLY